MNTHMIAPRTMWAVLAMEVGLVLPLISLPSEGDRVMGPTGALLIVLMLPLGYLAVRRFRALRDPSWRLLLGIAVALLTRAVVSVVPDPGFGGFLVFFAHSLVPLVIGVALWWRGAGLTNAELTSADVRTEFAVLGMVLLGLLFGVRPFLLADPLLLGTSVGIFAVGGLVGAVLSRQDAAEISAVPLGRTLGVVTALLPAVAAVVLVSLLRPSLLGSMWQLIGQLIELAFTPIGWLIAWLASLLPQGTPAIPVQPTPQPTRDLTPDPTALAQLEDRIGWIGYLVLFTLFASAGLVAILLVRVMLEHWLRAPDDDRPQSEALAVEVDATGDPGDDAHDALGWLSRWLRSRLGRRPRGAGASATGAAATELSARDAYQRLLEWAARRGAGRRPPETARELSSRLSGLAPDATEAVALVTDTYESDRYGGVAPPSEQLERVRAALTSLPDR
jgi:hypothetical protein